MFISLALTSGAADGAAAQHKGRRFALKIALGVLAVGTALVGAASAQMPNTTPTTGPTSANYRRVASACTTEYATFCATPTSEPMTGREQTMCLKYHKLDLSLGCRSAVNAATAAQ